MASEKKTIWCCCRYCKLSYTSLGRHYGYPQCCVDFFAPTGKEFHEQKKRRIYINGFVPCPTCADKIDDPSDPTQYEALFVNRVCTRPFVKSHNKYFHMDKLEDVKKSIQERRNTSNKS